MAEVKVLRDILRICSYCGRIHDEEHDWLTLESYVSRHTNSRFSHGICPTCLEAKVKPEFEQWARTVNGGARNE